MQDGGLWIASVLLCILCLRGLVMTAHCRHEDRWLEVIWKQVWGGGWGFLLQMLCSGVRQCAASSSLIVPGRIWAQMGAVWLCSAAEQFHKPVSSEQAVSLTKGSPVTPGELQVANSAQGLCLPLQLCPCSKLQWWQLSRPRGKRGWVQCLRALAPPEYLFQRGSFFLCCLPLGTSAHELRSVKAENRVNPKCVPFENSWHQVGSDCQYLRLLILKIRKQLNW